MKHAKTYENVTKRFYRPEIRKCLECQKPIKRAVTLSQRTVVTLQEVIKVVHGGYRCKNPKCPAQSRTYRSAEADALALPGFTFGLDIVLLVGKLHLGNHQTLDEMHETISEHLAPLGVSISRREVLYLFDAFSALLRATSDLKEDKEWLGLVEKNGGMIVSIDGIQPDQGNETIYLVRDALTGRLLTAENATESSTERIKQILAPVLALDIMVLGTISDAQKAEIKALEELWPDVPHQTCHFHALRDAGELAMAEDRKVKKEIRKKLQPHIRNLRKEIKGQMEQASDGEQEQLALLDTYALGMQAVLNQDGVAPFDYAGIEAYEALDDIEASLEKIKKKGCFATVRCSLHLHSLRKILQEREQWRGPIESLKRMRQWVLDAEQILDGSWASPPEHSTPEADHPEALPYNPNNKKETHRYTKQQHRKQEAVTNEQVALRFDRWREHLALQLQDPTLPQKERECLEHFLGVLDHLRPYLIQCYDREDFPRTNNETEGAIRKIKTRYRRISGRKNWNKYLLRHGRNVGFYDWWASTPERWQQFEKLSHNVKKELWIQQKEETEKAQSEQLIRYRFRHLRKKYLVTLENQWDATSSHASDSQSLILH